VAIGVEGFYSSDPATVALLQSLQPGQTSPKGYTLQQDLILRKNRLWIVKGSPFQQQLLAFIHFDPSAGHSGHHKTVKHAQANFYWTGMRHDIKKFVRECAVFQVNKHETTSPAQPACFSLYQFLHALGQTSLWIS
jgi:hypothetical protein